MENRWNIGLQEQEARKKPRQQNIPWETVWIVWQWEVFELHYAVWSYAEIREDSSFVSLIPLSICFLSLAALLEHMALSQIGHLM